MNLHTIYLVWKMTSPTGSRVKELKGVYRTRPFAEAMKEQFQRQETLNLIYVEERTVVG